MNRNNSAVAYTHHADTAGVPDVGRLERSFEFHAALVGVTLVRHYADHGERGGFDAMLDAAVRGEFGVLLIQHPDHLSRNVLDLMTLIGTLENHGVAIERVGYGRVRAWDMSWTDLMSNERREGMRQRTRFGLNEIARQGLVPGGRTYGYRPVPGEPGRRVVVDAEARVVVRIFDTYLEGESMVRIAKTLNLRGDTGRVWTKAAIERALGTSLYNGVLVYGRRRREVDRHTGSLRTVPTPASAWVVAPVEGLRIVPKATWEAVQSLLTAREAPSGDRDATGRRI